jgi:vancomycin aglycone glucosyltransferase
MIGIISGKLLRKVWKSIGENTNFTVIIYIMKIACVILGTQGDVQPMVAMGKGLRERGHEVTICAPPENEKLAGQSNCCFIPFGPSISKEIKDHPEGQKGGIAVTLSPKQGKKLVEDQINLLPDVIRGVELVLGAGIVLGVQTAADILGVPYRLIAFYPIILGTTKDDPMKNRLMFGFGRGIVNMFLKGFINKQRANFSLPPIKDAWSHWLGEKVIIACDKELHPARDGVAFPYVQTGFMLLPAKNDLPDHVKEFIDAGEPPVYIGFGSNPIVKAEKYSHIFQQVSEMTKKRLIISKGWAGLHEIDEENILFVDEMPFELLFPKMAAAIYHGGTGTMAAIVRAGIPQAAFPFMGDQFSNKNQIVKLGLGPDTCDFKKMTAESISSAIIECMSNPKYKHNATEISEKLLNSNGVQLTIEHLEKEFNM